MTNQIIKTLVETKQEKDYLMETYEIKVSFGTIKELHFTRPNNVHDNLTLKTIIRQWKTQEGKFRQNKRFVILRDNKELHSIYANTRWDSEQNKEYYENKQEITTFFYLWEQEKRISDLEAFIYGPKSVLQA